MSYSGLGSTTRTPPVDTCWIDGRPVPEDRRGLLPALCSDTCRAQWVHTYSLNPATHTATDDGWHPIQPAPESAPPAPKPGPWLFGSARHAL